MRGIGLALVGMMAGSLWAQSESLKGPIYLSPAVLRALQSEQNSSVPRVGLFGLSQPVASRFGWDRVQQDSSYAFGVAQTLWLDYYCLFGDSSCADLALIDSPRAAWSRSAPWSLPPRANELPRARPSYVPHPLARTSARPAVAVADSASVKPAPERQPTRITVRSGDSLYRILGRYPGLTIEELYRANKGSDRIYPGQILIVP